MIDQNEAMLRDLVRTSINREAFADVTTAGADTEFAVTHNLGRIPGGFLVIKQDKAGVTYDSGSGWTTEKIFLKNSVATVALRLLIF